MAPVSVSDPFPLTPALFEQCLLAHFGRGP